MFINKFVFFPHPISPSTSTAFVIPKENQEVSASNPIDFLSFMAHMEYSSSMKSPLTIQVQINLCRIKQKSEDNSKGPFIPSSVYKKQYMFKLIEEDVEGHNVLQR